MVKEEELSLLRWKIRSVIGESRGINPPYELLRIEIDSLKDEGEYESVEGSWNYFMRSGKFNIKIKKDDKSIVELKLT
jgi:hypothetical protein